MKGERCKVGVTSGEFVRAAKVERRHLRTALVRVIFCLTGVLSGCSEGSEVAWRIVFADTAIESRAVGFAAQIVAGPCNSTGGTPLYDAEFSGDEGPPTPSLVPGTYSFSATASDSECLRFAEGCAQVTLPVEGRAMVSTTLVQIDDLPLCDGVCDNGQCHPLDADVDDHDADGDSGGEPDSEPDQADSEVDSDGDDGEPDAEPDAEPEPLVCDVASDMEEGQLECRRTEETSCSSITNVCNDDDILEFLISSVPHPSMLTEAFLRFSCFDCDGGNDRGESDAIIYMNGDRVAAMAWDSSCESLWSDQCSQQQRYDVTDSLSEGENRVEFRHNPDAECTYFAIKNVRLRIFGNDDLTECP